jgi:hypothetical protein
MKRATLICLSLLFITITSGWGQVNRRSMSARSPVSRKGPEFYFAKPIQLIDMPTANILFPGDMKASLRLYEEGGILARLGVGISTRMMFGVSYGADHIIGEQIVQWNKMPGVNFAYRIKEESLKGPAMVVGLDTQGYGKFWSRVDYADSLASLTGTQHNLDRYSIKSKGIYAVISKNFDSFWNVNLHIGANYSLERSDKDTDPNVFMGMYLQFTDDLAAIVEYDAALNDDRLKDAASRRGYLNAGLRWAFEPSLFLEFDMKNLLMDPQGKRDYVRVLRIGYHTTVFN